MQKYNKACFKNLTGMQLLGAYFTFTVIKKLKKKKKALII